MHALDLVPLLKFLVISISIAARHMVDYLRSILEDRRQLEESNAGYKEVDNKSKDILRGRHNDGLSEKGLVSIIS